MYTQENKIVAASGQWDATYFSLVKGDIANSWYVLVKMIPPSNTMGDSVEKDDELGNTEQPHSPASTSSQESKVCPFVFIKEL